MSVKLYFSRKKADAEGYQIAATINKNGGILAFRQFNAEIYDGDKIPTAYDDFNLVATCEDHKILVNQDGELDEIELEELDLNGIRTLEDVEAQVSLLYKKVTP